VGELLLDQRVVAGIGNIWRSEALFLAGHHPWAPQASLTDAQLDDLVVTASRLMRASAGIPPVDPTVTSPSGRPSPRWVYGRQGLPCRRCRTLVVARRQGDQARTAYWCPTCQPAGSESGDAAPTGL